MLGEIIDGLQTLHFDTLTLRSTRANWVKRWSNAQIISLISSTMWVSSTKDEKMQLRTCAMIFRKAR
jgi:hypothetical protein